MRPFFRLRRQQARHLAGSSLSTSTWGASPNVLIPLQGASLSTSQWSGSLGSDLKMAGSSHSVSSWSGTLRPDPSLAGSSLSTSAWSGSLSVLKPLAGTWLSTSKWDGALVPTVLAIPSTPGVFPCLGGFVFVPDGMSWATQSLLQVQFESIYGTQALYQLYAGRQLIGVTNATSDRVVEGDFQTALWPEWLTIVAIPPDDPLIDLGELLPPNPYNRVRLRWTTTDWAADGAKFAEITAGRTPGASVDPTNVIGRVNFGVDGDYEFITLPLQGTGLWNFQVTGRDGTVPAGNAGTSLALSVYVMATPPDVATRFDGSRLTASAAAGVLTVGFGYGWNG